MPSTPALPAPHRDQMIARLERRREMLERLSEMGMKAAERLANRAWAPEVGADAAPAGLAFAKVARAVRLTLVLEGKIDELILAIGNGATPTAVAWLEPSARPARSLAAAPAPSLDAIESGAAGREPLDEREFDRLPAGGFKGCVAAICEDLEIEPDWSCWSDEEGFVHDDGRPVTAFSSRYVQETDRHPSPASKLSLSKGPSPLAGEGGLRRQPAPDTDPGDEGSRRTR